MDELWTPGQTEQMGERPPAGGGANGALSQGLAALAEGKLELAERELTRARGSEICEAEHGPILPDQRTAAVVIPVQPTGRLCELVHLVSGPEWPTIKVETGPCTAPVEPGIR